ncbi:MAG: nuclear transport factor 2 family protein [Ramlibacter sp.]
MHPNESALRDGYAAMAKGNGKQLALLLDPEAEWHIPGKSTLAGTYKGLNDIFKFWKRVAELAPGGLQLEVIDVFANDDRGGVFVIGRGARQGLTIEERGVHVFEFEAGKATSARFLYEDQDAYDRFWSA